MERKVAEKLIRQAKSRPGTIAEVSAAGVDTTNPVVSVNAAGEILVVLDRVETFTDETAATERIAELLSATPRRERRPGYWSQALQNFLSR